MIPVTFDAAENDPIRVDRSAMANQLAFEVLEAHVTVGVFVDDDDIGDRLAPRQFVGMVFVRPDEHDRPIRRRDRLGEVIPVVECRRDLQAEHAEQLGDGVGCAAAAEHHRVLVVCRANAAGDDVPRLLPQARGLQPGAGRFGVGVRVQRQYDGADVVLDEAERAPRCGVVGVDDRPRPVRPVDHVVAADHRLADVGDQLVDVGSGRFHTTSEAAR